MRSCFGEGLPAFVRDLSFLLAAAAGSDRGALTAALEALRLRAQVDECSLSRVDPDTGSLEVVASAGRLATGRGVGVQVRMPWTVERMQRGEPIAFSDPEELPGDAVDLRRWAHSSGAVAHVTLPLFTGDRLAGGLHLTAFAPGPAWSATFIRELQPLAILFAGALSGAASAAVPARSERLQDVERDHILAVLERCAWRINGSDGAADRLGLHPNTLRSRMKKLAIARPARAR